MNNNTQTFYNSTWYQSQVLLPAIVTKYPSLAAHSPLQTAATSFKVAMMGVSSSETSETGITEVQNPNNLSPFFKNPSLKNSTQIIPHKLNGKNYLE